MEQLIHFCSNHLFVLNTVLATVLAVLMAVLTVLTTVLPVLYPDRPKSVSTASFLEDFCQYGPEYACQYADEYTYPAPLDACLLLEKLI